MIAWIQSQAVGIGISIGLAFALGYGAKKLPGILVGWLDAQLKKAFAAGDDIDDELLRAICKWADAKLDRGFIPGDKAKFLDFAKVFIASLPKAVQLILVGKEQKIADILEANITALKTELEKQKS